MGDLPRDIVERAIAREPDAVRAFVDAVAPVIQGRVARALARRRHGAAQGRDVTQEVEDFTQEVFAALFADDARALRAWRSDRSPLGAFCALVADHQVYSIFRSGKRRPWSDSLVVSDTIEAIEADGKSPEARTASREAFGALWDRLRAELTPKGIELFERLFVDEESVDTVCQSTGLTPNAVHAWRSRLGKLARKLAIELEEESGRANGQRPEARPMEGYGP